MNLHEYNARIVRPSILRDIASGALDNAILDPDVLNIVSDDDEIMQAIVNRIKHLQASESH